MQYVLYILLIAVIFGLIALVDLLFKKLFPPRPGKVVRLPRYSFILGILITVVAVIVLLFVPMQHEPLLFAGSGAVLLLGVFVLVNFFRTAIFYDETGFSYRTLLSREKRYCYSDITGQRSFLARSGINVSLYVNGEELQLYQAMQGLDSFLNTAFFAWCKSHGTDPDTVDYDPRTFRYFPELAE